MTPQEMISAYERANNSHVWGNVEPFIHNDATYWFTDGSYRGIDEIEKAITATFEKIQNETYSIRNVRWIATEPTVAVCTYLFRWEGVVDGKPKQGEGRGTNVFVKTEDKWKIMHEHLSA